MEAQTYHANGRPTINRIIIELCCENDSRLGKVTSNNRGCFTIRVTAEHDLTRKTTVDNVVKLVNLIKVMELPVLLWVSIPCTGGTRLTDLNWALGTDLTRAKIEAHQKLYQSLFHNLRRIYACVVGPKVHVAIEWPNSCKYWKFLAVRQFIDRYDLKTNRFDGCMYGLTTTNGASPIRKPWRVDTNVDFGTYLSRKCDGTHEHVQCCGKHARESSH